jgi:NRPS condensation-like uncharacterized protein
MNREKMKKYPVEMLDEYIRLQESVNDHQIRCVLQFNSQLDVNRLRAAIIRSIDFVPLLSCQYSVTDGQPSWQELPFNIDQALFIESDNFVEDHYPKYFKKIPTKDSPQIVFQLIKRENNDVLIINVNHMVFDGSGFKTYLYLLASLYSDINKPVQFGSNVRSMDGLLKNINSVQQFGTLFRKTLDTSKIDLLNQDEIDTEIKLGQLKISHDQAKTISALCHRYQFTLNDFILGLFASSLFRVGKNTQPEKLSIQMMFDLRRYATQYPVSEFGNFSSMESVTLENSQLSLIETVKEISNQTAKIKSNFPGIKNVVLLNSLFKLLPINRFDSMVAKTIQSLGVSTSNLGVIDEQRLVFSGCELSECTMFTSIKNQPGLQLTFSTYKGGISLSILGNYSKANWLTVVRVLDAMKELLQENGI